ncbi:MAG: tRNA (adenosine(37)-N6)-threonylcarbamoyltransferase complex ATPase subunit type 1 TsaE, partial [Clostridia bacterium]|nr:tRNA (adenosine(37)-N6)-threonylcarbamoyltransferase complex ATPase subunit type 1 TsaE [Clostridia bacterium]
MFTVTTQSVSQTEDFAFRMAKVLPHGAVIAFFGGLGMGKTAFVRGLARGLGLKSEVSSPTFALVHDYGGNPPLYHFDMYRVETMEALYSTGYFDYLDCGAYLAVEWSENIENVLPDDRIDIFFRRTTDENQR